MSGTVAGGKKAAATNKAKYGKGFYARIGKLGGAKRPYRGIRLKPSACKNSRCERWSKEPKKWRKEWRRQNEEALI